MGAVMCLLGLALLSVLLSAFQDALGLSTRRARRKGRNVRKVTVQPLAEERANQPESESTRAAEQPVMVESGPSMASTVMCFCGVFGLVFAAVLAVL